MGISATSTPTWTAFDRIWLSCVDGTGSRKGTKRCPRGPTGTRTVSALPCCEVHNAEDHAMETAIEIETLTPAAELARNNPVRMPNESAEYRAARTALLAEEIELRRHIERVAALRRALPPGGPVSGNYRFMGPPIWPACSATSKRLSSTAICSDRNVNVRARCAPICWGPGKATPRISPSASRWWSWPVHR